MFSERDHFWMQKALTLAQHAATCDEVPVGALVVLEDEMIGEGYNRPISHRDPTAHAEIVALRQAAEKIGNYRLINTTLYVTLEPCLMCAGAMVHARIQRLVYGAQNLKTGAITSTANILDEAFLNHRVQYAGGLLADQCGKILSGFFRETK